MQAEPSAEHGWLRQLVGEWTFVGESSFGPDQPPMRSAGSESARMIGDLWLLAEGRSEMPGVGTGTMLITLGFDPARGRYVGTWVGSMMTKLWVYDGEVVGDTLNLYAEGPSFTDPARTARYRDAIRVVDADHRVFTGAVQGEDGGWTEFMRAEYTRTR